MSFRYKFIYIYLLLYDELNHLHNLIVYVYCVTIHKKASLFVTLCMKCFTFDYIEQ